MVYHPYNATMLKDGVNPRRRYLPDNKIKNSIQPDDSQLNLQPNLQPDQRSNIHEKKVMKRKPRTGATSRIPVSREIWAKLSSLRAPGETYDQLLDRMIEAEKERRFFEDMERIEKRGKFVPIKW